MTRKSELSDTNTVPHGFVLKQVLVVHRHGERTPVRHVSRIHGPGDPGFESLWRQCSISPFIGALHSFREHYEPKLADFPFPFRAHAPHYPPPVGEIKIIQGDTPEQVPPYLFNNGSRLQLDRENTELGLCHPGQLTDKGKQTLLSLGNSLREVYADQHHFLPSLLTTHFNEHNLYVRSTGYIRTIESVQYLLAGLFPFHMRELESSIDIHIKADENMYIDMKCKKLMHLVQPFKKAIEDRLHDSTISLMTRFNSLFPEREKTEPAKDASILSVPGDFGKATKHKDETFLDMWAIDKYFDTFKAMKAAGVDLPKGVTEKDVEALGSTFMELFIGGFADAASESIAGQSTALEVKQLLSGRFIGDILEVMNKRVQRPADDQYGIKLGLFSGHDTTIGPLLIGLGMFEGKYRSWPAFGSHITFELFEQRRDLGIVAKNEKKQSAIVASNHAAVAHDSDHYVRVRYNGVPMNLPFCQQKGSHFVGDPSLCSYASFNHAMSRLVPRNYSSSCKL